MSETRIATTAPGGYRRLGVQGQVVVAMHRQIATIVANRLGRQQAAYFARPEINPADGRIDWYAAGPARPLAELTPDERARLETSARQTAADIAQLAAKLKSEGASAELVGRMLDQALVHPGTADSLWAAAGQPVRILWGHAAEGAVVAADGVAPPRVPAVAQPGAVAGAVAEPAVVAALAARPVRWGWLAWLLPLLLLALLAFLAWKALQPLPPVVVDVPGPAAPAGDPLAALEQRERDLRARLDALPPAQAAAAPECRAPEPPPPQHAELPPVPVAPPAVMPPPTEPVPPAAVAELPPAAKPDPITPAKPEPVPVPQTVKPEPLPPVKPEPPAAKPEVPPPGPLAALIPPRPEELAEAPAPPPRPRPPRTEQPGEATARPPAATPPAAGPRPGRACNPTYPPGEEPEVVVIVDGSGSMRDPWSGTTRIDAARRSIRHVVDGMPPPVDIALVEFTSCTNIRRDKFYSAPERPALVQEVDRLNPTGGTPLARSIERAGTITSGQAESTVIVISDGEDTCGGDPCAAARAMKAKRPHMTINVVDISGGGAGSAALQCVASATGGRVLTPQSAADMVNKVQQATRQPDVRNCQ